MTFRNSLAPLGATLIALIGCRAETQTSVDAPLPAPTVAASAPGERDASAQIIAERIPLTIRSGERDHRFTVEVAGSREQQQRGLMFRESLAPDEGMLFPYPVPAPQSFWMRNTVIPLDIIFIDPDGLIANIAANTTPYSLDPIPSLGPVIGVLEIDGGRAGELGIEVGDRVSWPE